MFRSHEFLEHDFDLYDEPLVSRVGVLDEECCADREFTREELLAWRELEFEGVQSLLDDRLVVDFAGEGEDEEPALVPERELLSARATQRWLRRDWFNVFREGRDGERVVRGAFPFSAEEGASEWLARARSEMRELYRVTKTDRERAALVAREAALRARHNARCFARSIARYYDLVERDVLAVLDGRQKEEPIGWLGLEAAMRHIFFSLAADFQERLAAWNAEFDPSWSQTRKDEWLDRMPVEPEHPTQLVTSRKKLRPHRETQVDRGVPDDTPLQARSGGFPSPALDLPAGVRRFYAREAERTTEWFDVRKEWERAEMFVPERLEVPESLDYFDASGAEGEIPPGRVSRGHRCPLRASACSVCTPA